MTPLLSIKKLVQRFHKNMGKYCC